VADAAGISVSALKKNFRAETGFPPIEYFVRLKIQEAKKLLLDHDASVTSVAIELNFTSSQHFATMFKRYTGKTPGNSGKAARR
jgi:AraC-like DNA-binding protein